MAVPQQRDPEITTKQLAHWLGSRLPGASELTISNMEIPRTGFSNETFYFDAQWFEGTDRHSESLVVRVQPGEHQLFLGANVQTQFETMSSLEARSKVPVPKMFWFEADPDVLGRPFYVMGRLEGKVPLVLPSYHKRGWVAELSAQQRRQMWENAMGALAEIAKTDASTGFEVLVEDGAEPGLDSYIDWVRRWFEWTAQGASWPVIEEGLRYVTDNRPDDKSVSVVWGDAVSTNMIFAHDLSVAAVLDWEMATLGPPELDLGWWLFFEEFLTAGMGCQSLEGIPGRDETISHYESLIGRKVRDIEYYEIFAALRMSIISARNFQMQIEAGTLPADTTMHTNNPIVQILAKGLGLPIPDLDPAFATMLEGMSSE